MLQKKSNLNNYTTKEQGEKLLKLGIPVDSADCGMIDEHGVEIEILKVPYSVWCNGYENISFPCWSAGRLIEIAVKNLHMGKFMTLIFYKDESENLIDQMIDIFKSYKSDQYKFNF